MMHRLYKHGFSAALLSIATPPHQPILPLPQPPPPRPPLADLFSSFLVASSLSLLTSKLLITLAVDTLYRFGLGAHLFAYFLQALVASISEACALGGAAS